MREEKTIVHGNPTKESWTEKMFSKSALNDGLETAELRLQNAKGAWVLKRLIFLLKHNETIKDDALDKLVDLCYDEVNKALKGAGF